MAGDSRDLPQLARRHRRARSRRGLRSTLWWGGWLAHLRRLDRGRLRGALDLRRTPRRVPVWRIGALRSGLGVISVLVVPCPAAHGPGYLSGFPEETPAQRAYKLKLARRTLHRAAEFESLNRSWMAHAGSLAVNAAFSLWIWRGYHQPGAAAISRSAPASSPAKRRSSPARPARSTTKRELADQRAPPTGLTRTAPSSASEGDRWHTNYLSDFALAPLPRRPRACGGSF